MQTVHHSAEHDAWARGFDYDSYVGVICGHWNLKPVSKAMYEALHPVFHNAMMEFYDAQERSVVQDDLDSPGLESL